MILNKFQTMKYSAYYHQFPPRLDVSSFAGPCHLNVKVFTEDETKNILQACKANRCTVTGALTAAANPAFCRLLQDDMKGNENAKIKWEFTINARRCCDPKPNEDYLGFFVYLCDEHYTKYEPGIDVDFWKVAPETTKEIQDDVKAQQYVTTETMLCDIIKATEFVDLYDREMLTRLSACNTISSIGSFEFGEDIQQQPYKLHECFISGVLDDFPLTFTHFNHTINGKMSWQIVHDTSRVEVHHAEKFASLCFSRFSEIAHSRV